MPRPQLFELLLTNPAPNGSLAAVNNTGSWQLEIGASGVVQQTECDDPQATLLIRCPSNPWTRAGLPVMELIV